MSKLKGSLSCLFSQPNPSPYPLTLCLSRQVDAQLVGATFQIRCNMTGQPFPFVSWRTPDGATTIGSSRLQVSPQLNLDPPRVTMTLMASEATNGTLTVMAQNVYGVGTEKIHVLVKPLPTTTTTTTTNTTTTTATTPTAATTPGPDATTAKKKEEAGVVKEDKAKETDGGSGSLIMYISAGVGGAALLLSAIMVGVACRKMNRDKIQPEKPTNGQKSNSRNNKSNKNRSNNNNNNNNRGGDKNGYNGDRDDYYDDDDNSDDDGIEEMSYGRVRLHEVRGARPPTAARPISAWDV